MSQRLTDSQRLTPRRTGRDRSQGLSCSIHGSTQSVDSEESEDEIPVRDTDLYVTVDVNSESEHSTLEAGDIFHTLPLSPGAKTCDTKICAVPQQTSPRHMSRNNNSLDISVGTLRRESRQKAGEDTQIKSSEQSQIYPSMWDTGDPFELIITPQNIDNLLISARFYNKGEVIALCMDQLLNCTVDSALYYKYLAEKHELTEVLPFLLDYVRANFTSVVETHSFVGMGLAQLTSLLSDDGLQVSGELDVYFAARTWINHNKLERLRYLDDVMECVRFMHIRPQDILLHVEPDTQYIQGSSGREVLLNVYRYHALINSKYDTSSFRASLPPRRSYVPLCRERPSKYAFLSRIGSTEQVVRRQLGVDDREASHNLVEPQQLCDHHKQQQQQQNHQSQKQFQYQYLQLQLQQQQQNQHRHQQHSQHQHQHQQPPIRQLSVEVNSRCPTAAGRSLVHDSSSTDHAQHRCQHVRSRSEPPSGPRLGRRSAETASTTSFLAAFGEHSWARTSDNTANNPQVGPHEPGIGAEPVGILTSAQQAPSGLEHSHHPQQQQPPPPPPPPPQEQRQHLGGQHVEGTFPGGGPTCPPAQHKPPATPPAARDQRHLDLALDNCLQHQQLSPGEAGAQQPWEGRGSNSNAKSNMYNSVSKQTECTDKHQTVQYTIRDPGGDRCVSLRVTSPTRQASHKDHILPTHNRSRRSESQVEHPQPTHDRPQREICAQDSLLSIKERAHRSEMPRQDSLLPTSEQAYRSEMPRQDSLLSTSERAYRSEMARQDSLLSTSERAYRSEMPRQDGLLPTSERAYRSEMPRQDSHQSNQGGPRREMSTSKQFSSLPPDRRAQREAYNEGSLSKEGVSGRGSHKRSSKHQIGSTGEMENCSLLAVGGLNPYQVDPDVPTRLLERYDPRGNVWSLLTKLPDSRHHHACMMLEGFLYLIGGSVLNRSDMYDMANPTNSCYRYDLEGNYWTVIAPMRSPRMYHAGAVLKGVIYAIGGQTCDEKFLNTIEYYNPDCDSWGHVASLLDPTIGVAALGFKNYLYVIGGFLELDDESIVLGSVECFDPRKNRWISRRPLPSPRCHASAVEVLGRMYLVGGSTLVNEAEAVQSLASVLRYNEWDDVWETFERMQKPRHDIGCAVLGNRIYILGGVCSVSKMALQDVECLDVARGLWLQDIEPLCMPTIGLAGVGLEDVSFM